jgi:hypothetical protein
MVGGIPKHDGVSGEVMSPLLLGLSFALAADQPKPLELVLAKPTSADVTRIVAWKTDGYGAVAFVLDDDSNATALKKSASAAAASGLAVYLWIEVGRNPDMAREHPEWMSAIGMHADWRKRFPNIRAPEKDEVFKAWPWVPISHKEAFAAHKDRVERLLKLAPVGYRGLLLNDLQAGPSSCGCGNLQCRWAVDYHAPSTATLLQDAAPTFLAEIGKLAPDKDIIPVWTTECEQEDLPAEKRPPGSWGTGYCGSVPCFDYCRQRFGEQWTAMQKDRSGPTALLALHHEFGRDKPEYGGPAAWVSRTVDYCKKHGKVSRERLWLVVQGYDVAADEAAAARKAALQTGVAAVIVAQARIDQSYEPRIWKKKD